MQKELDNKSIISFLTFEFKRRKALNPSYSLRAFASYLDVSPASLSQVMNGKRKLLGEVKGKIVKKLEVEKKLSTSKALSYQLTELEMNSSWHCDAILELIKYDGFKLSAPWISKKLKLTKNEAQAAISKLKKKKLILNKDGKWIDNTSGHTSHITSNSTNFARKNYQMELLNLSMRSIEEDSSELRDHSSMMVSIKKENLLKAKSLIKEFRRELAGLIDEEKDPDAIYQLCINFFPITKETIQ